MAKKNKTNPRAEDFYTLKAKKEGYPARSVYKLTEIKEKFSLFTRKSKILDIGAAPGSWSLYILKQLSETGFLLSVDLLPLEISNTGNNFETIIGDAFSLENQAIITEKGPFNVVLSDVAPATTGNRTVDSERSLQLVTSVLDLAEQVLILGGNLAVKIFQGGGEKEVMERMKKLFATVKAFKPEAARKTSFETYLIGIGRKKL